VDCVHVVELEIVDWLAVRLAEVALALVIAVPAVVVTARLFKASLEFESLIATLMPFAEPVEVECSTRWAPSAPLTTVAVTPGLLVAELIADAMPATVLLVLLSEIVVLAPLTVSVIVEEPDASAWVEVKPVEVSTWACATCFTSSVYDPAAAPVPAVAVMPVPLVVAV